MKLEKLHKKPRYLVGILKTGSLFVFFASAGLTLFNVFGLAFKATSSDAPSTRLPIWGGVTLCFLGWTKKPVLPQWNEFHLWLFIVL